MLRTALLTAAVATMGLLGHVPESEAASFRAHAGPNRTVVRYNGGYRNYRYYARPRYYRPSYGYGYYSAPYGYYSYPGYGYSYPSYGGYYTYPSRGVYVGPNGVFFNGPRTRIGVW